MFCFFFFFFLEIHVFQFLSIYSVHSSIKDSFFFGGGYLNLILYSKLNSFCLQNQFKTSLIVDFCKHTLDYLWHFDHTEAGLRGRVVGGGGGGPSLLPWLGQEYHSCQYQHSAKKQKKNNQKQIKDNSIFEIFILLNQYRLQ